MTARIFYKWSTLRRIFKYFSWVFRMVEKPAIRKYAKIQEECSPIFIIGLPRSGSTYLYQVLTSCFDVLYFDNLVNLGRSNLYFSVWLSRLFFKNKTHQSFSSEYGNTDDSGLHAPSEAGNLWYRWFPKDVVEVQTGDLTKEIKNDLKMQLAGIIGRHKKPLLIKNLYMVTRMKVLKEIFPEARYIYIQRDPLYIAQSIYLGRIKNTEDPASQWWSVPVQGYKSLLNLPLEEQVAHQVFELQKMISDELADIDPAQLMVVEYEKLVLSEIAEQFGAFLGTQQRKNAKLSEDYYKAGNVQKVNDVVFSKLQLELNRIFEIKNSTGI